jgi:hypothetical protein
MKFKALLEETERNTPTMGARAERAFEMSADAARVILSDEEDEDGDGMTKRRINSDFEHGQWWITDLDTGAQWSVCDTEGTEADGVFDGFCFEQVSRGGDE